MACLQALSYRRSRCTPVLSRARIRVGRDRRGFANPLLRAILEGLASLASPPGLRRAACDASAPSRTVRASKHSRPGRRLQQRRKTLAVNVAAVERLVGRRGRSRLALRVMAYAPVAGQISPAGVETAKSGANPALSRNCDAPPAGMSQV